MTDDELWRRLVYTLPSGVRLTAIMDCCHSGTGLDLPFQFQLPHEWEEQETPSHSQGHAVLFSGCDESGETAQIILDKYETQGGAMTHAFISAYGNGGLNIPFVKFIDAIAFDLENRGFDQKPQLGSSQKLKFERFNITEGVILGNANPEIGRSVKR